MWNFYQQISNLLESLTSLNLQIVEADSNGFITHISNMLLCLFFFFLSLWREIICLYTSLGWMMSDSQGEYTSKKVNLWWSLDVGGMHGWGGEWKLSSEDELCKPRQFFPYLLHSWDTEICHSKHIYLTYLNK